MHIYTGVGPESFFCSQPTTERERERERERPVMKLHLGFCVLFLLVMFGKEIEAIRKGQEEYWKAFMGDEKMPEAINQLLSNQQEKLISENPSGGGGGGERLPRSSNFNSQFDVSAADAIIYHPYRHHHHRPENPKTSSIPNSTSDEQEAGKSIRSPIKSNLKIKTSKVNF